jgi:hypothetical protein
MARSAFYDALVKALVDAHAEVEDEAAFEIEIDADKASQKPSS